MKYEDKQIGFSSDLVPLIKEGSKTFTYRLGDKYDFIQIGDVIKTHDSSDNQVFAELEIIEKSYTTFGELPIDRVGHEAYPSKEVQRETFKKYYKRDIADDEKILVLGFKVLNFL